MALVPRSILVPLLLCAGVLSAVSSADAQAIPLGSGQGTVQTPFGERSFQFSLVQRPDGSVRGQGVFIDPTTGGWSHVQFDSAEFIGSALMMAGPVVATNGSFPGHSIGATVVLAVQDNGNGAGSPAPDSAASIVGPPGLTVPMILTLIGPPPPQAYLPLDTGNIVLR